VERVTAVLAGGPRYASVRALRRAFELRVGPVPNRIWRRLALPASWAPFTATELDDLIAWWRQDFQPHTRHVIGALRDGRTPIQQRGTLLRPVAVLADEQFAPSSIVKPERRPRTSALRAWQAGLAASG
jgi:hypothetical protein